MMPGGIFNFILLLNWECWSRGGHLLEQGNKWYSLTAYTDPPASTHHPQYFLEHSKDMMWMLTLPTSFTMTTWIRKKTQHGVCSVPSKIKLMLNYLVVQQALEWPLKCTYLREKHAMKIMFEKQQLTDGIDEVVIRSYQE